MIHKSHELYTGEDFTQKELEEDGILVRNVLEGGLAVCKKCGDYEAGLDTVCKATLPKHIRRQVCPKCYGTGKKRIDEKGKPVRVVPCECGDAK